MHINNEGPERTSNDHDGLLKGYTPDQIAREAARFPIPEGSLPLPNYPDRLTVEILEDDEQYVKEPLQRVIAKYVTGSKSSPEELKDTTISELDHFIRYSARLVDAWEVADFQSILRDATREVTLRGEDTLNRVSNLIQVAVMTASLEHEVDKIVEVYSERGFLLEAKASFRAALQMLASEVVRTRDWVEFGVELRLINGHAELVLNHAANTRIGREQ